MARINTSPEALDRWLRVLENAALVHSRRTDREDERFYLTVRAQDALANLAALNQLRSLPDCDKIQLLVTSEMAN